ncbi:MAG TPA: phosphonate ABC transporter, permease protein PhnE [Bradyrhizobium sp.]|nr:phosphonate ABC transporter, permease protein PhnE [Bradyrhizobium sp.]
MLSQATREAEFPPYPSMPVWRRMLVIGAVIAISAVYWVSFSISQFDLQRLAEGIPVMVRWLGKAWPPDFHGLDLLLYRAVETFAMALVGTTLGCIFALPLCLLAARNINRNMFSQQIVRVLLNALRGTDTMIFAIIFVVAVGLGPFAGVLGVCLHTAGVVAKLWSEAIEALDDGPMQAAMLSGATLVKTISYALMPDAIPILVSVALYAIEFNVRASTVLGLVGAGGIGQELKNSVDLLNFPRIFTIVMLILIIVTLVDQLSGFIRRRLI